MNVLVLGSGGRENALCWKIRQSRKLKQLFIAPGNGGSSDQGKVLEISINDFEAVAKAILDHKIDMLVVGPEDPLVNGIYDFLKGEKAMHDLMIIGPSAAGAVLEGSKSYAKTFMNRYGIPTAGSATFSTHELQEAKAFLHTLQAPYVLKADGLAAGKGVVILDKVEEAEKELEEMFSGKFGVASSKVVIEEFLDGIEVSVFAITDGKDYVILPEAKDYKRIGEGDVGLNTGGMGAVSPVPFADKSFMKKVEERIIKPSIDGIAQEGFPYVGFVFFGLMSVPFWQHLIIGSILFGAVYMATDPVSGSQTNKGKWIYGFLIGFISIMIRVFNPAYPEGVFLAILLMNVFAPTIDHYVVQGNVKKRMKRLKAKTA